MDYLKTAAKRGIYGIFIGVFIGQIFVVIAALTNDTLVIESRDYLINFFGCAVIGYYCVAISICYDVEEWSLLRQTTTHAILISPYIVLAYFMRWTPQGALGMVLYVIFFIITYAIVWYCIKLYWQKRANEINELLESQEDN